MLRLELGGMSVGRIAPQANVPKGPGGAWQGGGIFLGEKSTGKGRGDAGAALSRGCWSCAVPRRHGA